MLSVNSAKIRKSSKIEIKFLLEVAETLFIPFNTVQLIQLKLNSRNLKSSLKV